jgi:hypothetical protein
MRPRPILFVQPTSASDSDRRQLAENCYRRDNLSPISGGIAQLVERLVRNEKVRGSNPLTSTKFHDNQWQISLPLRSLGQMVQLFEETQPRSSHPQLINSMNGKVIMSVRVLVATFLFAIAVNAQTRSSSLSAPVSPSPTPSAVASESPAKQTNRPIPFHGMVSGVDQNTKTFTISGKGAARVFKVTERTVITKGAATVTMKDIADNEEISGAYWKDADGTLEAKMVRLGPMERPKASPSPKPSASAKP